MRRFAHVVSVVVLAGCGGSMAVDAGDTTDAATVDASPLDASPLDASPLDAGATSDGATPAPVDDAAPEPVDAALTTDAPPSCDGAVGVERCNLADDDCDGRVDEAGCGRCTTVGVDPTGEVVQLCPSTDTGVNAWNDSCERLGAGYRLAPMSTEGSAIWLGARVNERRWRATWVGLRRSAVDDTLRDSTGSVRSLALLERAPEDTTLDGERCFALTQDGLADYQCNGRLLSIEGFACAGAVRAAPRTDCTPEVCNGLDDDCDGLVDGDACDSLASSSYAGHTYYYFPETNQTWEQARASCQAMGTDLATDDSPEEHAVMNSLQLVSTSRIEVWLGARESEPDVWAWTHGAPIPPPTSGDPRWGGVPGTMHPLCMFLGARWDDSPCSHIAGRMCERGGPLGP